MTKDLEKLDEVRLASSGRLVGRNFKTWTIPRGTSEEDALDELYRASDADDSLSAKIIVGLLKKFSLNDLIVEGVIKIGDANEE